MIRSSKPFTLPFFFIAITPDKPLYLSLSSSDSIFNYCNLSPEHLDFLWPYLCKAVWNELNLLPALCLQRRSVTLSSPSAMTRGPSSYLWLQITIWICILWRLDRSPSKFLWCVCISFFLSWIIHSTSSPNAQFYFSPWTPKWWYMLPHT